MEFWSGWWLEPTHVRFIVGYMDPLEKCLQPLRALVTSGDDGSIGLAEKAVNQYLAAFSVEQQADALYALQVAIGPLWRASSGRQTVFINMVLEYTDKRMRVLQG